MSKTKITKRSVDALAPTDRIQLIYDTELPGFGIRLMPSGHGAYIIEYRPGGGGRRVSKKRMAIGTVGSLTPDEARKLAKEKLADVAKGHDPLADRQTMRREIKVAELIDRWNKENPPSRRSGKPLAPLTKSYTLARLTHHVLPIIGTKRVSEVSVAVVNDLLQRITRGETQKSAPSGKKRGRIRATGGAGAARKVASDLSIIMAYAVERQIITTNPVSGARKPKAGKRHTFLTPEQVQKMGTALREMESDGFHPFGIAILRLLMLTGARPSEIEQLKWDEVDFHNQCLRLHETKTGYSQRPLSAEALAILRAQPRQGNTRYIFPAVHGDGFFSRSKAFWNEARKRANLPHVSRYDARHMVATLALGSGADIASVAAIMGHATPRTTLSTYAHVIHARSAATANNVSQIVSNLLRDDDDEKSSVS